MKNYITNFKLSTRFLVEAGLIMVGLIMLSTPFLSNAATLTRQLEIGMSGSDVTDLQTFLAQDRTIYPQGLVTGYFGPLTKSAVSNFQSRNGISTVGRVGPITLAAINAQMGGIVGGVDVSAPFIIGTNASVSNNSATVSWTTSELARGNVFYSTSPLVEYEYPHTVSVSGNTALTDNNLRSNQSVAIGGLSSNTLYFYLVYVSDASGNVSITLPSSFRTN